MRLILSLLILSLISCNSVPQPIILDKDICSFCKMGISDQHFGAEIINEKGKIFKFDDMHCILGFIKANTINNSNVKGIFLVNFAEPHNFIKASKAVLLKSSELHSPMGGNVASFNDRDKFKDAQQKFKGKEVSWNDLVNEK